MEPRASIEAALDWWRDAGVDCDFRDEPIDWLAGARQIEVDRATAPSVLPIVAPADRRPADPRVRLTATPNGPPIGGDPARWPQSLERFGAWWLTEPMLDIAPGMHRVAPSGPIDAPLMVLVPMPEHGDTDTLLGGSEGRLLDSMLCAMGLARDQIYLASGLPSAVAMPDWPALAASGLTALTMHHVALARPKRLLVLGKTDISSLITHDPANNAAILPSVNQERTSVPVSLDYALATLLAQPSLKRRVWMNWLESTEAGLK